LSPSGWLDTQKHQVKSNKNYFFKNISWGSQQSNVK